ncbi:MAG: translation initiation factor [Pyramidobacter sp.]|jgi:translation initiation factor 1
MQLVFVEKIYGGMELRNPKKKIALDVFDGSVNLAEALGNRLPLEDAEIPAAVGLEERKQPQKTGNLASMHFRISIERKGRAGKTVTLLSGFEGDTKSCRDLAKRLKSALGCGAALEEDRLVLQGDQRERLAALLRKQGATKVSVG